MTTSGAEMNAAALMWFLQDVRRATKEATKAATKAATKVTTAFS